MTSPSLACKILHGPLADQDSKLGLAIITLLKNSKSQNDNLIPQAKTTIYKLKYSISSLTLLVPATRKQFSDFENCGKRSVFSVSFSSYSS